MPTFNGPPPGMGMGMAGLVDAINSNPLLAAEGDADNSGKENDDIDIDLGSVYANGLGFDSTIKVFVDSAPHDDGTATPGKAESGTGSAKKKKKNKKKKKK